MAAVLPLTNVQGLWSGRRSRRWKSTSFSWAPTWHIVQSLVASAADEHMNAMRGYKEEKLVLFLRYVYTSCPAPGVGSAGKGLEWVLCCFCLPHFNWGFFGIALARAHGWYCAYFPNIWGAWSERVLLDSRCFEGGCVLLGLARKTVCSSSYKLLQRTVSDSLVFRKQPADASDAFQILLVRTLKTPHWQILKWQITTSVCSCGRSWYAPRLPWPCTGRWDLVRCSASNEFKFFGCV